MFGYTIIKKDELEILKKSYEVDMQLLSYMHWFSGWPHVYALLVKFSRAEVGKVNVWELRDDFAKAMKTDRYGQPKTGGEDENKTNHTK